MTFKPMLALFPLILFGTPLFAQIDNSICLQCLTTAKEEFKKCLDAAISQEDKASCAEKNETRTKSCDDGECKIEQAAQSGNIREGVPEKNRIPTP